MPYIVQSSDLICGLPEHMALHFARLFDLKALPCTGRGLAGQLLPDVASGA
jgi:hypothetical protein